MKARPDIIRVAIVEDDPDYRTGLSMLFEHTPGHTLAAVFPDAADAVAAAEDGAVVGWDLVLMDIEMPVMDGLEATEIIKKRWPHIKVIILTLYTDYLLQAHQAGADAFLVKGCSTEELRATICAQN